MVKQTVLNYKICFYSLTLFSTDLNVKSSFVLFKDAYKTRIPTIKQNL